MSQNLLDYPVDPVEDPVPTPANNAAEEDAGDPYAVYSLYNGDTGISNGLTPDLSQDIARMADIGYSAPVDSADIARMADIGAPAAATTKTRFTNNSLNTGIGANKKEASTGATLVSTPGRRRRNPLNDFSSFTYQLSLYMVTPDAQNAITEFGTSAMVEQMKIGNVVLVAQSGGIGDQADKAQRAKGIDLDVYIDDLIMITNTGIAIHPASSSEVNISFKIFEPYGISFVSKLINAAQELLKKSKIADANKNVNILNLQYAIGIRFYGYDKNGDVVTAAKYKELNPNYDVSPIDEFGLFERIIAICISDFNFKLDGKGVTCYNVTAKNVHQNVGLGVFHGKGNQNVEISAGTVGDALTQYCKFLNEEQIKNTQSRDTEKAKIRKPNLYQVEFDSKASEIRDSSFITEKLLREFSSVKELEGGDDKIEQKSDSTVNASQKTAPNPKKRRFTVPEGQSIVQTIEQMIAVSNFPTKMVDLLKSNEHDKGTAEVKEPKPMMWFSITPHVTITGYDVSTNEYSYFIKYKVRGYDVPYLRAPYGKPSAYLGPHKVYDYWYTGKNTDILVYEQNYNNLYMFKGSTTNAERSNKLLKIHGTGLPGGGTNAGHPSKSGVLVEGIMTDLYSLGDTVITSIQITGDPDYIIQSTSTGLNALYAGIYGIDNYTINPTGGQVFFEINFNQTEDYKKDSGLLEVNNNIKFYLTPEINNKSSNGYVYQLRQVTSTFSKGKFTQKLDSFLVTDANISSVYGGGNQKSTVQTNKQPAIDAGVNKVDEKPEASKTIEEQPSTEATATSSDDDRTG